MLRLTARSFITIFLAAIAAVAIFFEADVASAQALARLKTGTGGFVSLNADKSVFNRDGDKKTIDLSGNVQIVFDNQFISCDRATIDETTQTILAAGNLVVSSPQAYVEGDSAVINYRDNTGVIQNGFVKSGQVLVEGDVVRKTGPDTYEAEHSSFTACTTCPTAWTFSGSRINAEMGGYAHIRNAWLRVANVPIFWLPYLIVPLKSERQTGLLVPSFDYTESGGFAPSLNYFWALSRSQDATLTVTHYAKRGVKALVNYRYVLNQTSEGELNYGFIRDRVFEGTPAYQPVGSKANRWFTTYFHNYDMPGGYNQKLKLNFVSDLRYPRDFPQEVPTVGDPALENRLTLTRNTERTHSSLDTSYYINQLKTSPLADNKDAVHRWPEIRWALIERPVMKSGPLSGLLFNTTVNYVNFAREDFAFDDVTIVAGTTTIDTTRTAAGANVFNPATDVIRAGQRFDIQPQLSYPFRLGNSIDVLPSVQFRHTQYSLNVTPSPGTDFETTPYREYVRSQLSLRTRFSRIYGDRAPEAQAPRPSVTNWVDAESRAVGDVQAPVSAPPLPRNLYRHEVEPEIVLAGVAPLGQTEGSTFFGDVSQVPVFLDNQPVSNSDFLNTRKIQFDYEDRMTSRNTVAFVLNNRLVRRTWVNGSPGYKQIASLKLGQSFDYDEDRRSPGPKFPYSDISALLDVRFDRFETNTLVRHFPYHNKTNTSSRAKVMDDRGRYLQLNVSQTYLITQNVDEAYSGRTENVGFQAGFDSRYLSFAGTLDYRPLTWEPVIFERNSWSAFMNIKPPGNCWGIRASFRQDIGGEVTYKFDFDYNFGGETIGSSRGT